MARQKTGLRGSLARATAPLSARAQRCRSAGRDKPVAAVHVASAVAAYMLVQLPIPSTATFFAHTLFFLPAGRFYSQNAGCSCVHSFCRKCRCCHLDRYGHLPHDWNECCQHLLSRRGSHVWTNCHSCRSLFLHLQRWILLGKRLCNAVSDFVHVICMRDSKSNFESVLLRKQPAINNPVLGPPGPPSRRLLSSLLLLPLYLLGLSV